MRRLALFFLAFLWLPYLHGETTNCQNPTLVPADGRIVSGTFAAAAANSPVTYWYAFAAQAGHSYSIEFVPTTDNEAGTAGIRFIDFNVFAPGDPMVSCRGQSSITPSSSLLTANAAIAPGIARSGYGAGRRVSFIQPSSGVDLLYITSDGLGGGTYSYRIVDTTLFGPHWTTYGWETEFSAVNMSDMQVQGILTFYAMDNSLVQTLAVTIPAGGVMRRSTRQGDLNTPRNREGYVYFAHNAPPGVLLGDAFMSNSALTVAIPTRFEAHK